MDLKVLRKLNMRRRISCSRAASKYCWGVKYGMAFFFGGEDTVDDGWVSSPKRAVLFFWGGFWVDFGDVGLVGWKRTKSREAGM